MEQKLTCDIVNCTRVKERIVKLYETSLEGGISDSSVVFLMRGGGSSLCPQHIEQPLSFGRMHYVGERWISLMFLFVFSRRHILNGLVLNSCQSFIHVRKDTVFINVLVAITVIHFTVVF